MINIPLYSCVAERVYNELTDLLAENNVSTRFTDQVQTKEPVGNLKFSISNVFIFSGLQGKQQEMKYYISKHKLTTRDEIIVCIHDK